MQKILTVKKDYEREGFHLQRLYKRRIKDERGMTHSTMDMIMKPPGPKRGHPNDYYDFYHDLCHCRDFGHPCYIPPDCLKLVEKIVRHCDDNARNTMYYIDSALTWQER